MWMIPSRFCVSGSVGSSASPGHFHFCRLQRYSKLPPVELKAGVPVSAPSAAVNSHVLADTQVARDVVVGIIVRRHGVFLLQVFGRGGPATVSGAFPLAFCSRSTDLGLTSRTGSTWGPGTVRRLDRSTGLVGTLPPRLYRPDNPHISFDRNFSLGENALITPSGLVSMPSRP
jgi:hypothetical protein